jgi:hypothetical protein
MTETATLQAIVLAYNADWSLRGGLQYLRDTVKGDEPCELCRITYGGVFKKGEWKACEKDIRAPVREVYKNQASPELEAALSGSYPAVLAETDQGYRLLVSAKEMDAFDGQPAALYKRMVEALEEQDVGVQPQT